MSKYEDVYNDDNDYEEWFNQQKEEAEKQFQEFVKQKTQNFDAIVEKYSPKLINLRGDEYRIATKMVFYCVLSNQLKHNFFNIDIHKNDLRIPLLIILKAGHGKKNYEHFIKHTIKGLHKEYVEPTSFHPEQFLGKIIVSDHGKNGFEYTPVYGTLSSDFVLIDDAHLLLSSKKIEYQESLKHIRTALDPIGFNEIEKKQVNVPYAERLHYFPMCNIVLMSQPIQIDEELISRGSFRRFVIVKVDSTVDKRIEAREQLKFMSTANEETHDKSWENWIEFNNTLSKRKVNFIGDNEDFDIIDVYINELIQKLINKSSREALEFTDSTQFNLKFLLFKMAAIRAICEQTGETVRISRHHIELSIDDHRQFWDEQIAWISQQMELKSDRPKGWKDSVHGWVLKKLRTDGIHYKSELVDRYLRKYEGTYAVNTLKQYIYNGIKDLRRWDMIEEFVETPANDKKLKITKQGLGVLSV